MLSFIALYIIRKRGEIMKYFVASDIHGFFNEFKAALDEAGYDVNNPNHHLIICGDIFDRGLQANEVYNFLRSIPKDRRTYIRGNHEYLLKELTLKYSPQGHDISNGTLDTLSQLSGIDNDFRAAQNSPKVKEILDWIDSDEWVDFLEIDKYIFVHSFIPLYNHNQALHYYFADPFIDLMYVDDWRKVSDKRMIEGSTWGCPWKNYLAGLFEAEAQKGKILVCGHWHANDFYLHLGGKIHEKFECYDIYRGVNIIALDGCTARTRKVNVMIINEDFEPYYIKDKEEVKLEIFADSL